MKDRVLYALRFDVHPNVGDEYSLFTVEALLRGMQVPGIQELRVFHTAAGAPMVNLLFEFASHSAWSEWCFHPEIQTIVEELTQFTTDLKAELWQPSPMLPEPVGTALAGPAVRYVLRWDLLRDTMEEYTTRAEEFWQKALTVEGLAGISAYRAVAGSPRVMIMLDFADLASWATWYSNPIVHDELLTANGRFVVNTQTELWMPSPRVPDPLRA